jgi:pimeloyl-ACP methyl ester carboxylesterase
MATAKVNGIEIYYETHGEGDPVVLIVGLGGNHLFWEPLIPALSANNKVVIFDWRGVGYSEVGAEETYTTQMLASDVAGLMEQAGIDQAHILGRSMGGCIAQSLAINHPEKVKSLTAVSTWGRADAFLKGVLESWTDLLETCGDHVLIEQAILWGLPRHAFSAEFKELSDEVTSVATSGIRLKQRPAEFRKLSRAGQAHNALAELHKITVPTLVMVGREDILTPMSLAYEIYDLVPGSELMVFERAGHAFYEQMPDKFAQAAVRFWARAGSLAEANLAGAAV